MRKKGLSYVDWAISVGIFIVYAIILFFIFRPSLQQDYSQEYLGEIIKAGIEKDAYYSMERVPLFII